jgi:formate-dependent nitrite reductase membrane component NrfD
MISAAAHDTNYMSEGLFGYMLVTLDIVFILTSIAACIATVFIIRDKIRKMNKVKQKMKRAMSIHVAKMKSKEWLTTLTHETNEGGGKNLFHSTKGKKSWWATLFVGFVFCLGVLISWCLDFLIS